MAYTSPTPVQTGQSGTIVWGTKPGGVAVAPVLSGIVLSRISLDPSNPDALEDIYNGDGAITDSIFLVDGFKGRCEGIYNASLTYPLALAVVTLALPKAVCFDAPGGVPTLYANYPIVLHSNPITFEWKGKAMISFNFSHHPGRDGVPVS